MNEEVFPIIFYVRPCMVKDDYLVEDISKPAKQYNPFNLYNNSDNENIYIKFASINYQDPPKIIEFISNYGFLGLNSYHRYDSFDTELKLLSDFHLNEKRLLVKEFATKIVRILKNPTLTSAAEEAYWINLASNPDSLLNDIDASDSGVLSFITGIKNNKKSLYRTYNPSIRLSLEKAFEETKDPKKEDIKSITKEIIRMRLILSTLVSLYKNDLEGLNKSIYEYRVFRNFINEGDSVKFIDEYFNAAFTAKSYIEELINEQLQYVNPYIYLEIKDFYNIDELYKYKSSWKLPDLLSCMYVMLYMDITGGKIIRKCKNTSCNIYFSVYGNDTRKEFCSPRCAAADASRNYRRRKKEGILK